MKNRSLFLFISIVMLSACQVKNEKKETKIVKKSVATVVNSTNTVPFSKNLSWNQFQFKVEDTVDFLKITPVGLEIQKDAVKHAIKGFKVTGADIGDLNLDSSPEVFIYLEAINNPSERKLIGYSVNNGKSMSQVALPSILKNKKVNKGYKGYDEMAIVESTFCQRFPIYTEKPTNHRSGKTRQIQYKLVNGEAGRVLKIDKIIEY